MQPAPTAPQVPTQDQIDENGNIINASSATDAAMDEAMAEPPVDFVRLCTNGMHRTRRDLQPIFETLSVIRDTLVADFHDVLEVSVGSFPHLQDLDKVGLALSMVPKTPRNRGELPCVTLLVTVMLPASEQDAGGFVASTLSYKWIAHGVTQGRNDWFHINGVEASSMEEALSRLESPWFGMWLAKVVRVLRVDHPLFSICV